MPRSSAPRFTMTGPVYPEVFEKYAVKISSPAEGDQKIVDDIIFRELVNGILSEASRLRYNEVIDRMRARGCDCVILGCTEIPLLVRPDDCPLARRWIPRACSPAQRSTRHCNRADHISDARAALRCRRVPGQGISASSLRQSRICTAPGRRSYLHRRNPRPRRVPQVGNSFPDTSLLYADASSASHHRKSHRQRSFARLARICLSCAVKHYPIRRQLILHLGRYPVTRPVRRCAIVADVQISLIGNPQ